jgi:hypothetical protein
MTEHAVVIAGGGPTGRASQDLTGPRTCGLHSRAAGIEFPGWDATTGCMIAEVEMAEEPAWGYAATRSGSIP